MFPFDVTKWTPRFILNDKNGNALAKAIEAGVQAMNDAVLSGIKRISDNETMPEWRLDEMAWEYNIPYDYTADVETKKMWISKALELSRLYGTSEGIRLYLIGCFENVTILENWEYDGDPYHFKVELHGNLTRELEDWAVKAIEQTKNVRSVLDRVDVHMPEAGGKLQMYAGIALYGACTQTLGPIEGPNLDDETFLADGLGNILMDGYGVAMTC